jgi:hypothetical protein
LVISVISKYELIFGSNQQQDLFWIALLQNFFIISYYGSVLKSPMINNFGGLK